ncbi:MAG TPA: hypothetical protein VGD50_03905 [Candidatus Baltobacteraceae bacterium]
MPILPLATPQPVPIYSGFDYVTVDSAHRRVYAAHSASGALLVVDADSGLVLGQARTGPIHGVAVDPVTGHVYAGSAEQEVVEVDPQTFKVLREAPTDGPVDAIAYDPANGRIYADEDNGTRVFVIDAATFKVTSTITIPGHKPEYLAVDPVDHDLYQNIADLSEYVEIDRDSLKVKKTVPTPELTSNHPLQYDSTYKHVLVAGKNGVLSTYDDHGKLLSQTPVQADIDQCSLDHASHILACAGGGKLTATLANPDGTATPLGAADVPKGVHTVGIDSKTGNLWVVWAAHDGDFVQAYSITK